MASPSQVSINLIGKPKTSFAHDFAKWTFNAGRIIIAVTELVALGALGYRFYVDSKIIDLHDKIKTEQAFVSRDAQLESKYRSIQTRLSNIKTTEANTNIKIGLMNSIIQTVSTGNFSSTTLTIDQETINFEGIAVSIFPINSFIDTLKKNTNIASISLDDVTSTNQGIQFKIAVELKQK